jgi:mono/diheme cytochrome c family protein
MTVSNKRYSSREVLMQFHKVVGSLALFALLFPLAAASTEAQSGASTWEAPEAARKVENPVKVTPQGLKVASQLFQENCVPCHGNTGAGNGPAASALTPKPANFTDASLMSKATDGELFWKMSNGRGAMPSWAQFSETQRWQLVNYIRTLSEKAAAKKKGS